VLALIGGVASLVVSRWTLDAIGGMMKAEARDMLQLELNPAMVVFAFALSVVTGLLFGMFPALQSTRPDLITSLRSGAGHLHGGRASSRFRTSLVTVQIALSMMLLVCAGLFVKSLRNVSKVNLGLNVDGVVTFAISPELNGYNGRRSYALFQRVHEELGALPGVTGVTAARVPLLAGNNWGNSVAVQGFKKTPDTDDGSRFNEVSPGYFHTLGVKLIAGREFTAADGVGGPRVAVVNQAFAKKFGLGRDAVGKLMGANEKDSLDTEIVGLIENAKYSEVKAEVPPVFYTAVLQDTTVGSLSFYVRTAGDPAQVLRAIPGVMKRLDPNLPVEDLKTMPQQVRDNVFLDRMISILSAAFAVLATLLAAVGLYGVLAYTVAQRTREIGVRMALGADAGRVRLMVLRQVGLMTLVGGAVGIAAAIAVGKAASSLLFELKGNDPTVAVLAAITLAAVAFAAGYVPARRASEIHPMQALRYE
jgi:predicted permease